MTIGGKTRQSGANFRKRLLFGIAAFLAASLRVSASPSPELVVSCGAVGREFELCRQGVETWSSRTGNSARVISAPADSGERFGFYLLQLAARSTDIDVFLIDTTWPGMIGDFFVDLRASTELRQYFPSFLENNTVRGRLVALPWFIDAGLLFYREDLLKKYGAAVPQTWQELTQTAERIQQAERNLGHTRFWGFVFQGRAYEGLTCNALEWIASFGGGNFVDAQGKVDVNNPQAAQALTLAASWVNGIAPPGVLNYQEEEARGAFQSGNALFMRNWPYAWKLAQSADSPVRGKVGVSELPSGSRTNPHVSTLGGWSLAVSRFSQQADKAVDLIRWLASPEEQKRRALEAGLSPTFVALYLDPAILAANPLASKLLPVFQQAVARPARVTGGKYNRVSAEIQNSVHRLLEKNATRAQVDSELASLAQTLRRIGRNGKW